MKFALLKTVNFAVNNLVKYKSDPENYGRPEYWVEAHESGDCEDYALRKRKMLRGLGWPAEDLNIAVCYTEDNQLHAVLVATFENTDYVLDNRANVIWKWSECNYKWVKITVNGLLLHWKKIDGQK